MQRALTAWLCAVLAAVVLAGAAGAAPTGPRVLVGGFFSNANGQAAARGAVWDGGAGVWSSFAGGGVSGGGGGPSILALETYRGLVYVGGTFAAVGTGGAQVTTANIATWNATSGAWAALGGAGGAGASGAYVLCFWRLNGRLYIGGLFGQVNGATSVGNIVAWDGATISRLGSGTDGNVNAIADYKGNIFATGTFTNAGGSSANRIARWDGAAWWPLGSGLDNDGWMLYPFRGLLYVGGKFTTAGGTAVRALIGWNGAAYVDVGQPAADNYQIHDMRPLGTDALVVAGRFSSIAGVPAANVAVYNSTSATWSALGGGTTDTVMALAVLGPNSIYAAGYMAAQGYLAYWNGTTWTSGVNGGAGVDNVVRALLPACPPGYYGATCQACPVCQGTGTCQDGFEGTGVCVCAPGYCGSQCLRPCPYVLGTSNGGSVFANAGPPTDGSARAYGDWAALGAFQASSGTAAVNALAVYRGGLVAGGYFTSSNGNPLGSIGFWSGTGWTSLDRDGVYTVSGYQPIIYGFAVYNDLLVAVGDFVGAASLRTINIALWNGATLSWSGLTDYATGLPFGYPVHAVTVADGQLYVAGMFTSTRSGTILNYVAKWGGTSWTALGSGLVVSPVYAVSAIVAYKGSIVVGGFFLSNNAQLSYIQRWNGTAWQAIAGGLNYYVQSLVVWNGLLVAAGAFTLDGIMVGQPTQAHRAVATWDGDASSIWAPLGHGMTVCDGTYSGLVGLLAASATRLLALSSCNVADDTQQVYGLAEWDTMAGRWSPVGGWNASAFSVFLSAAVMFCPSGSGFYGPQCVGCPACVNGVCIDGLAGNGTCVCNAGAIGASCSTCAPGFYGPTCIACPACKHNSTCDDGLGGSGVCVCQADRSSGPLCETCLPGLCGAACQPCPLIAGTGTGLAVWNGSAWPTYGAAAGSNVVGVHGDVHQLLHNGRSLIVVGNFTSAGGMPASNIAQYDGLQWAPFGTGLNGPVYAVAVLSSNVIVVGGAFTHAGATPAAYMALWDGSTWKRTPQWTGTGWTGGGFASPGGPVYSVLASGGLVIAAGDFPSNVVYYEVSSGIVSPGYATFARGLDGTTYAVARVLDNFHFAAVGAFNGHVALTFGQDGFATLGTGVDGNAYCIATYGGTVIIGGDFAMAGATAVAGIAQWNGTSWLPLGTGFDGTVWTLQTGYGFLWAGGAFGTAGGVAAPNVARWDAGSAAWAGLPAGPGGVSTVRALVMECQAGAYGPSCVPCPACVNGRCDDGVWGSGTCICRTGFGGTLCDLCSPCPYFAAGVYGTSVGQWSAGTGWTTYPSDTNTAVHTLVVFQGALVAGGSSLEAWTGGATWTPVGGGISGGAVSALGRFNGSLVVGGTFTTVGAAAAVAITVPGKVALYDGSTWRALPTGVSAAPEAFAEAPGPVLYVGGLFATAGGVTVNNVARWNGAAWTALGPGLNDAVHALAVTSGGDLVAGGEFTAAGATTMNRVGRWNGVTWSALGNGFSARVRALVTFGSLLVAGGDFAYDGPPGGPNSFNYIARWTGTAWSPMYDGFAGSQATVLSLAAGPNGTALLAGGSFTFVLPNNDYTTGLATWRSSDTAWTAYSASLAAANAISAVAFYCQPGSGHYGPSCLPCPDCGAGYCADGILGNGTCFCGAGATGAPACRTCLPGYFGPACSPCACALGTCQDGFNGTGQCLCNVGATGAACNACLPGYYGPACAPCPACGAHGSCADGVNGTGLCACALGHTGTLCDACTAGRYGPACTACECTSLGVCAEGIGGDGTCACAAGAQGARCEQCASGYYGSQCTQCPACVHGQCNDGKAGNGTCACQPGATGPLCDHCAPGFFGADCDACPACVNGVCSDGDAGTGLCVCNPGTGGLLCDTCFDGMCGPKCLPCPIVVGGAFDDGGPLLRWNGSQWAAAPGLGSSGVVNALVAFNGVVVVGGEFAAVPAGSGGGPPSSNIASWDGQAWGNLNGAAAAGLNGPVYTMYAHPVGVVVGGSFTHAGDQNLWSPNIAFLIPNFGWQGLWPGTDGPVYASSPGPSLDSDPSWVYVGGNFAHAGGVAVGNIAVYNGTGWFALASGTDGPVYSLVAFGLDALYAGGDFQHAGGVTVNNLARWDGAVWTAVAGGTDSAIWALSRLAATLVAAGSFGLAGSTSVACVAQVQPGSDGALWSDAGLPAHVGTPCNVTATFSAGWAVWAAGTLVQGSSAIRTAAVLGTATGGSGSPFPQEFPPGPGPRAISAFCTPGSQFFGSRCEPCRTECKFGACSDGLAGTGRCVCTPGTRGVACDACDPGVFGSTCASACACPPNSVCSDGITGTGACTCEPNWAGPNCTTCASGYYGPTCAACPACVVGTCRDGSSGNGTCACPVGRSGSVCNECSPGYYGPACTACPACVFGTCRDGITGDGTCACPVGKSGSLCQTCAPGYYGIACVACPACAVGAACRDGVTGNGTCACQAGATGPLCQACAPGYFGPSCTACPACGAHGNCRDGISGNGTCACLAGFNGTYCNTTTTSVTPTGTPTPTAPATDLGESQAATGSSGATAAAVIIPLVVVGGIAGFVAAYYYYLRQGKLSKAAAAYKDSLELADTVAAAPPPFAEAGGAAAGPTPAASAVSPA